MTGVFTLVCLSHGCHEPSSAAPRFLPGLLKDPEDKKKWVTTNEAAPLLLRMMEEVERKIFRCVSKSTHLKH